MPEDTKSKLFDSAGWLCVLGALIILFILIAPGVIRIQKLADLSEAKSNARSLGVALFEFDHEYGVFPNENTSAKIRAVEKAIDRLSGKSSNSAFRQLVAADITHSETAFYANISGTHEPDGFIRASQALEKGEVGFSYISGLSSKDAPKTPLALTPLILGTTIFDPKPFRGRAVVLYIDNSVTVHPIQEDGSIRDDDGDILSPEHPVWKGEAPDIRYPEF